MKKKLLALVMCAAMLLVSCTEENSSEIQPISPAPQNISTTPQTTSENSEPVSSDGRQVLTDEIKSDKMPEVLKVEFSGKCDDNITEHANISDMSGHVLHSGVVGRIGVPIELKYDSISDAQITFYYDKNELRGVPEKNLILLYCLRENAPYNTVESAKLDTEKCTVSAAGQGNGVYLLADAYQWYSAWGLDASKYAYENDKSNFKTDWEREFDTGSIMQLADKEWAKSNAPDFHISTPQQLASAVYYVNGINPTYNKVSITLESDIDLTGYDWRPMGWNHASNHAFCGTVDGKGHYIKGMKIHMGYEPCGFIGYGWDAVMKDIIFINADVSGTHSTGIAGGEVYSTNVWTNVYTQGKVDGGGRDYGAIIGRESSISFKDCSADVTVDGKPFKYFSYKQKQKAETKVVEYFHLTRLPDGVIVRDHHDGFENLGWIVELDGQQILDRATTDPNTGEQELELPFDVQLHKGVNGKHTIYLAARINDAYVRVSNIIEYEGTGGVK